MGRMGLLTMLTEVCRSCLEACVSSRYKGVLELLLNWSAPGCTLSAKEKDRRLRLTRIGCSLLL